MSTLRQNLAFLMSKHQLTANTLAKETGVPQPTISRILSGESSDPRDATLGPIASRFGIELDTFRHRPIEGADQFSLATPTAEIIGQLLEPTSVKVQQVRTRSPAAVKSLQITNFIDRLVSERFPEYVGRHGAFNYESPKLLLVWKTVPTLKGDFPEGASTIADRFRADLWKMSMERLCSKDSFPERVYIFAVCFYSYQRATELGNIADCFLPWVTLPTPIVTLTTEASAHEISFISTTPQSLVEIIEQIEEAD